MIENNRLMAVFLLTEFDIVFIINMVRTIHTPFLLATRFASPGGFSFAIDNGNILRYTELGGVIMNLAQCEEKTDIDSDLKQLFYQCSDYSKKCHLCPYTNQRTDGFSCSLVDIIQSKMGGIDNGKSKD